LRDVRLGVDNDETLPEDLEDREIVCQLRIDWHRLHGNHLGIQAEAEALIAENTADADVYIDLAWSLFNQAPEEPDQAAILQALQTGRAIIGQAPAASVHDSMQRAFRVEFLTFMARNSNIRAHVAARAYFSRYPTDTRISGWLLRGDPTGYFLQDNPMPIGILIGDDELPWVMANRHRLLPPSDGVLLVDGDNDADGAVFVANEDAS
jgi:hypothetical protein